MSAIVWGPSLPGGFSIPSSSSYTLIGSLIGAAITLQATRATSSGRALSEKVVIPPIFASYWYGPELSLYYEAGIWSLLIGH